MAVMPNDSNMKRGEIEFQFSENIAAVKWFDNRGVTLVGTALEGCDQISSTSRCAKGHLPVYREDLSYQPMCHFTCQLFNPHEENAGIAVLVELKIKRRSNAIHVVFTYVWLLDATPETV